jgi:predicted Zn-dependent peptidase
MIQTHTLSNGMVVLMEKLSHLRSASVGVFVKAGSILESEKENGLSHFIEHMAFKGTQARSAKQLAEEIDLIGGNVNAATSKICTSFYARTTDKDLPRAVRLLADLVVNAKYEQADFEKERGVILEEIAMEADSPEDLVFNLLHRGLYGSQTLSQTILGSKEAISGYDLKALHDYRASYYQPGNAVLAVAGRFDPEKLIALAEEAFSGWQGKASATCPENLVLPGELTLTQEKDVEQAHICLSFKGMHSLHEDRYALIALSTALGGGVSSRLFQRVREEQGLVYSIYSSPSFYPDCGDFTVYAACAPRKIRQVLEIVRKEIQDVIDNGLGENEFQQTMAQLRTGFVLGMESAYQRMSSMGINQLLLGRVIEPRETLALMRSVRLRGVNRIAAEILGQEAKTAIVGKGIEKHLKKKAGA